MSAKAMTNQLLLLQQQMGESNQGYSNDSGLDDASERRDRSKMSSQFSKTQMCKFNLLGACNKGSSCGFAHSDVELKSRPDLSRTRLCRAYIQTGQCNNANCTFAHTKEELRA